MTENQNPLENLPDDALHDIASYEHPFDDDCTERIKARFAQKIAAASAEQRGTTAPRCVDEEKQAPEVPHRRTGRFVALFAAAALIVLAGFAYADRIQELFVSYFGGGAEVAKQAQVIGSRTTDQGIKLDVAAAINDGETTYLVVDLQDTTGDRLSDKLHFGKMSLDDGSHGYSEETLSYDPESKTATLMVQGSGLASGETATLSISNIYANRAEHSMVAEDLDLEGLLGQGGTFEDIDWMSEGGLSGGSNTDFVAEGHRIEDVDRVLVRDEMHVAIPGLDTGYLSNICYQDGLLHVQMNPTDEVSGSPEAMQSFNLIDTRTDEEIGIYYEVGYGTYEHPKDDLLYLACDYREAVFRIDEADLPYYRLHVYGFSYDTLIEGNWEVAFTVPERIDVLEIETSVALPDRGKNFVVDAVSVSPLGVKLSFTYEALADENAVDAAVQQNAVDADVRLVYRDGTERDLSEAPRNGSSIDLTAQKGATFIIAPIEDFDDLVAVTIDETVVDLRARNAS